MGVRSKLYRRLLDTEQPLKCFKTLTRGALPAPADPGSRAAGRCWRPDSGSGTRAAASQHSPRGASARPPPWARGRARCAAARRRVPSAPARTRSLRPHRPGDQERLPGPAKAARALPRRKKSRRTHCALAEAPPRLISPGARGVPGSQCPPELAERRGKPRRKPAGRDGDRDGAGRKSAEKDGDRDGTRRKPAGRDGDRGGAGRKSAEKDGDRDGTRRKPARPDGDRGGDRGGARRKSAEKDGDPHGARRKPARPDGDRGGARGPGQGGLWRGAGLPLGLGREA
ncbi:Hypothetical predicted protein [Marmota monax]|uniref:Uncharacterized protein n=1 Tax=Marmota monax TaxID=9995 RepID=A0A5E4CQX8_MARMO|nr:Hypothetical predicted protein [Marmota monax]